MTFYEWLALWGAVSVPTALVLGPQIRARAARAERRRALIAEPEAANAITEPGRVPLDGAARGMGVADQRVILEWLIETGDGSFVRTGEIFTDDCDPHEAVLRRQAKEGRTFALSAVTEIGD